MNIYFDESGCFANIKSIDDSFICALIIPDQLLNEITDSFYDLKNDILGTSSEVKGSELDIIPRYDFCEWISQNSKHLTITVVGISSYYINWSQYNLYRIQDADRLKSTIDKCKYELPDNHPVTPFLEKLYRRFKNVAKFSHQEYIQYLLYKEIIIDAFQHSIAYYMDLSYSKSFHEYNFIFDRKLKNKLSECEKIVNQYLIFIYSNRSKFNMVKPINTPDNWESESHPFRINFCDKPRGILLNKVFENGFQFIDSKNNIGLQIVDWIVNTFYQAWKKPDDRTLKRCENLLLDACGSTNGKKIHFLDFQPLKIK